MNNKKKRHGCGGNDRRTRNKHVVVPHPSASWMLTFTLFAAPSSSETQREKRHRKWEREQSKFKPNQNSVINVFCPWDYSNISLPAGRVDSYTFIPVRTTSRTTSQRLYSFFTATTKKVKEKWQGKGDKEKSFLGKSSGFYTGAICSLFFFLTEPKLHIKSAICLFLSW